MKLCPKCMRKLTPVFNEINDELAVESFKGEIIIGNCQSLNYYCENCDEYYQM